VIVCDTGPLVAAALANDDDHVPCAELLTGMHLAGRPLLVPGPVIAEVGYLLARQAGPLVEALFLRSLGEGDLQPVDLRPDDYVRMAKLVQYADLPLGTTDAAVVAVTERLGLSEVATLDHRHFSVVRPRHRRSLVLLA